MTINALIPNTNNNNNIAHTENIPIQQRQIPLAFNKQYGQAISEKTSIFIGLTSDMIYI